MQRRPWALASLAVACALALGACSKRAEDSPVAPGRPGTGNGVDVVQPAVPDSPPGGSSGVTGSSERRAHSASSPSRASSSWCGPVAMYAWIIPAAARTLGPTCTV